MSDWNFWLYITGYTGATVARLVIQAINAARKDRLGTKVFAGILAGVAGAGVAINFAIIFLMMKFLPTVLQHAGFHVFTSIFPYGVVGKT